MGRNPDIPAMYRIRVIGGLDESWSDRLGGMSITQSSQGEESMITTLQGELMDQAALFGVLKGLYDMRLPVISVECLNTTREDAPSTIMEMRIETRSDYLEFIAAGIHYKYNADERFKLILTSCELTDLNNVLLDFRDLAAGNRATAEIDHLKAMGHVYQQHLGAGGKPIRVAVVIQEEMMASWHKAAPAIDEFELDTLLTSDYAEAKSWLTNGMSV